MGHKKPSLNLEQTVAQLIVANRKKVLASQHFLNDSARERIETGMIASDAAHEKEMREHYERMRAHYQSEEELAKIKRNDYLNRLKIFGYISHHLTLASAVLTYLCENEDATGDADFEIEKLLAVNPDIDLISYEPNLGVFFTRIEKQKTKKEEDGGVIPIGEPF